MLRLFRWLARCPLWFLHGLGTVLGWATYWASPSYRRRFHANARQAGVTPRAARPAIAQAGKLVAELPFLWLRPATEPIRPRLAWQGLELVVAALRRGRGVLLLTPHMGSFEVTAQACAQSLATEFGPITVLYRPATRRCCARSWTARAPAPA